MSAPAVDLAGRILKLLASQTFRHATLTEVSTTLNAPKSTCLRVLRALEAHSLVDFDTDSRKYSLGIYNVLLGARAEEGLDYLTPIRGMLSQLAEQTRLTAVYAERIDDRLVYVAKQDPLNRHSVSVFVGNRFPLSGTSIGVWWLIFGSDEDRAALLREFEGKIGEGELERFQHDRVIVSHGEYIPGISMISSPLLNTDGRLVGVLAVIDTMPSLIGEQAETLADKVRGISANPLFLS